MKIGMMSFAHLHAEAYIHNLRAVPDVELIGIADEEMERGRHFAGLFNANLFPTYEALLAERPDGVLVCSENARHKKLVELAVDAGVKYILCEKPLAINLAESTYMMEICRQAGVRLMTAFPMRFNTPVLEIKKLLDQDGLGQVFAIKGENQGQVPSHHRQWFVQKELAGGGAVMDHTVHLLDLMRWMMGSEVKEVYAQTNRIMRGDEVEVETGGLVMLTFENGVFASINCSWSRPRRYPTWGGLSMEIIGERGVAATDAFRQNITAFGMEQAHTVYLPWGSDSNQGLINEFCAAIREQREPAVTGFDGHKALEVVLAAYRSAETGQPVRLPQ